MENTSVDPLLHNNYCKLGPGERKETERGREGEREREREEREREGKPVHRRASVCRREEEREREGKPVSRRASVDGRRRRERGRERVSLYIGEPA